MVIRKSRGIYRRTRTRRGSRRTRRNTRGTRRGTMNFRRRTGTKKKTRRRYRTRMNRRRVMEGGAERKYITVGTIQTPDGGMITVNPRPTHPTISTGVKKQDVVKTGLEDAAGAAGAAVPQQGSLVQRMAKEREAAAVRGVRKQGILDAVRYAGLEAVEDVEEHEYDQRGPSYGWLNESPFKDTPPSYDEMSPEQQQGFDNFLKPLHSSMMEGEEDEGDDEPLAVKKIKERNRG